MKILKKTFQSPNEAHEDLFIIKGIFKKRFYSLTLTGLVELPVYELRKKNEEK